LDKQYRVIDKQLADLQLKSRLAQDEEDKKIFELSHQKKDSAEAVGGEQTEGTVPLRAV
jgi:hypothetical protein